MKLTPSPKSKGIQLQKTEGNGRDPRITFEATLLLSFVQQRLNFVNSPHRLAKISKVMALMLCLLAARLAAQPHTTDRPAVHGMVVFGTHTIYASHLPLFRSPHHYQLILQLELAPEHHARFLQEQSAHPDHSTYTLAPEPFVLSKMLKSPTAFKALLYRGHFERGGTAIMDSLTVRIVQVLYAETLPRTVAPPDNRYFFFGNSREQFAVHQIAAAPDYDHIVQVRVEGAPVPFSVTTRPQHSQLPNIGGGWQTLNVTGKNTPVRVQWLRQLYLEFDDLGSGGQHGGH